MEITVKLKYAHIAPRKMRLVADAIKGRSAAEAELVLGSLIKRSAGPVLKLLKSAKACAVNNFQLDGSDLYVKNIQVHAGPIVKRMMPRAFGRGATIRKRTSHVVLALEQYRDAGVVRQTASGGRAMKKRKGGQTVVWNAQAQDPKTSLAGQEKLMPDRFARPGEKRMVRSAQRTKGRGSFAPKIFQRKAI